MSLGWKMVGVSTLLYLLCLGSVQAGKLLVIPADGSHWTGMKPLVEELGRRGNQVVVVIPEASLSMGPSEHTTTLTYPVPYTKAQMKERVASNLEALFSVDTSTDTAKFVGFFFTLQMLQNLTVKNAESLLYHKDLMVKLKDLEFDALLTDTFEPLGTIVAEYLNVPLIYLQGNHPCDVDLLAAQCPGPASYVPRQMTHFTDQMSFWQRSVNTVRALLHPAACRYLHTQADKIASKFLQREITTVEMMSRAAIWLMANDFTIEFPRPLMPNMVPIGVISHNNPKPLSEDLEEFVNGSGDHGFVVFTLGSMVSELPEAKAREFFEAFRQIPQRVLWRYTGVVPKDAPKNVKLMKWLPQNDLLAHPKAKAFITHGGTHGLYEGLCNGVPMVMIPLFGDQGDNVQRMVVRGVAESLNIFDITSEKLLGALRKVINDKSYKEKMMKLSAIHKDRPVEPLDLAVFWTEFVMRHKGAQHLRPAAHDLNWVQYHSLDVIGFLFLVLVTFICVMLKTCQFCFRRCCRSSNKKKKE
ncbi:UDP-glucuronosyltransferase 1A1 isoform X10 [Astyanax mexicanus]|uniref:UDP-glucuronosyltransferase 1A1 isoform X10 n=1 Tax=Astyanax mexicanus TaxID=7994 RepID=UPI0020CADCA3|nr:UDP-glucuronosyltransferase 1A1 isoform X10 [Astyanax mexicanus]